MPLNFEDFVATKTRSEAICAAIGFDDGQPERGGFIYDAGGAYIEDNTAGTPEFMAKGKYYLLIERQDWVTDDLARLELLLWSNHYVFCEQGVQLAGADLDKFIQGICDAYGFKVDGDVFGVAFSGFDALSPTDALAIIQSTAHAYSLSLRVAS